MPRRAGRPRAADSTGRRARTVNSTTGTIEYFGYGQDGRLLQDWSNRRNVRNGYIYLGNTLVGLYEVTLGTGAVASRYKHTDALGSPVAMTDAAQAVLSRTSYTPYGVPTLPVDGVGYTGHFIDVNTSLTYMQQRYYDPQIGRFLSIDPVSANPSTGDMFSRFEYAKNNPYRFTDPDGRAPAGCGSGKCNEKTPEEKTRSAEARMRMRALSDGGLARAGKRPSSESQSPSTSSDNKSTGGEIQVTVGVGGTIGAIFGFGGGGGSVGITSNGNVLLSGEAHGEVGFGIFGGAGISLGVSYQDSPTKPGYFEDTKAIVEGNLGWGPSAGGSVSFDQHGVNASRGAGGVRAGAGFGAMVGVGLSHTWNYASEPIW